MIQAKGTKKTIKGSRLYHKIESLKRAVRSFILVLVVLLGLSFIVATGGGNGGGSGSSSGTISGSGE